MQTIVKSKWVQQVFNETTDSRKFELFAAEFCSRIYNKIFVCTSQNYDLGIDAKNVSLDNKDFLCVTLQNDAAKPEKDAKVIKQNKLSPGSILFLYGKPVVPSHTLSPSLAVPNPT